LDFQRRPEWAPFLLVPSVPRAKVRHTNFGALAEALNTVLVTEGTVRLKAFPKICRSLKKMVS